MLMPSRPSTLMTTKRSQCSRSPSVSGLSFLRNVFLNFRISLTSMLVIKGWVAAIVPSVRRTFWNSSLLGGKMDARLLTSEGSSRSKHREMLNGQDAIHALKAESPLAIEEVGDVGLLEARLLCQTEAGGDRLPQCAPKEYFGGCPAELGIS